MLTEINPDSLQYYVNYIRFPDPDQYTRRDITLTHYDDPVSGADSTFVQENLRSRVSWTEMIEEGAQDTVYTLYSYDPHGNVKSLLQDLPGIGYRRTDYVYDLVSGNVNFVLYQHGEEDQLMHRYSYDADNRIREVQTSTDGFIWNSDARYIYYPHSLSRDSGRPLARVELGEYNVQGMDYYYTLQGWLKGVNMPMEGDPGTDGENGLRTGRDAFAFSLGYHEGDYTPINPNVTLSDGRDQLWERYKEQGDSTLTGLYNGNISWMNTDLPGLDANQRMQAMVYGYDQLHRIVQARSLTEYSATGYAPSWAKIGGGARCRLHLHLFIFGICNSSVDQIVLVMGEAYQIRDQEMPYFLTFQVVGWADVFSRKVYRDFILENLTYCRKEKGLYLFGYVIMTNHLHLVVQQKDGRLSDWVRDFKKFTSKKLLKMILDNPQESRKEWLKMIFNYHAKSNKRSGELQFWTHENHAIELYRPEMIESRMKYIHENPVRAGIVEKPEDYMCSSARNYAGLRGLIEVDYW